MLSSNWFEARIRSYTTRDGIHFTYMTILTCWPKTESKSLSSLTSWLVRPYAMYSYHFSFKNKNSLIKASTGLRRKENGGDVI